MNQSKQTVLRIERTDTLQASIRGEWCRDDDHLPYLSTQFGIPHGVAEGGDYYSFTLGPQWSAMKNVVVRPDVRWDRSNIAAAPLDIRGVSGDLSDQNQVTAALRISMLF